MHGFLEQAPSIQPAAFSGIAGLTVRSKALRTLKGAIKNQKAFNERRRRAVEVALRLFPEKGFHNTKIKEIAEGVGLRIGCPYNSDKYY